MAKKKTRTKSKKVTSRSQRSAPLAPPSAKLLARLEEAEKLIENRQWAEALTLLTQLDRAYPNRLEVVGELVNVAHGTNDMRAYQTYAERLVRLEPGNVEMLGGLAAVYLKNQYPFLALTTFYGLVHRFPDHPRAAGAGKTIAALEDLLADSAKREHLTDENALDVMALNDRLRVQLQNGELLGVRDTARQILALAPAFIPTLNNLSLGEFMLGDIDRGIELAEQALALDPLNFQALSNLARFQFMAGQPEQANQTADRLLSVTSDNGDIWIKKAEALSYLGRNQDVLAVVEAAEAAGFFAKAGADPMLYHYRAVAAARTGDRRTAKRTWQMALTIQPDLSRATENLADLAKPVGERAGAWAFAINSWLSQKALSDLRQMRLPAAGTSASASTQKVIQRFIKTHPDVLSLSPVLMERGDPTARRIALALALQADTPTQRTAVADFVTGPHGPDDLRIQAAQTAVQKGILPYGLVSMWIEGKQQNLLMIGFTVTEEPIGPLPPAVEALYVSALNALNLQDFEQGAQLLEKAIQLVPNEPSLLNNLALAYEQMGRLTECRAIQERIYVEFPDYLFGIVSQANGAITDGEFEKAHALLGSLLSRQKLHIAEFRAVAEGFIRLLLAEDQVQGAERWMELWEGIEDDHPDQAPLRLHLSFRKTGGPGPSGANPGWLRDMLRKSLKTD